MRLFKPFSNIVQLSTKQEWNRRIKDDSVLNAIICPEWIEQFSIMIEKVLRWNHHHHHYRRWGNVGFSPTDAAIFFLEHLLLQGGSKLKSQRVLSVKQQAFHIWQQKTWFIEKSSHRAIFARPFGINVNLVLNDAIQRTWP